MNTKEPTSQTLSKFTQKVKVAGVTYAEYNFELKVVVNNTLPVSDPVSYVMSKSSLLPFADKVMYPFAGEITVVTPHFRFGLLSSMSEVISKI